MEGTTNMEGTQINKSQPEVGIALFGLGQIGSVHLDNLRKNPRARLIYCVEASTERTNFLKSKFKLNESETIFLKPEDKDKVFKDKRVDAVIICTWNFTHEELVLKSLEAGKAVFCEKPLAVSEEGIKRCLDAVKKYSRPLQTGFNRRFDPGLRCLKARVDAGEIGKVHVIKTCSRDPPEPKIDYLKTSGLEECEVSPESVLAIYKIATACGQVVNSGKSISLNLNGVSNGY